MNPEKKTPVTTSIDLIMKTMKAQPIILKNQSELFKASSLVGSSATESFVHKLEQHKSEQMVVIASNRPEIHEQCIDAGVRLLVLTSGHVLSKELRDIHKAAVKMHSSYLAVADKEKQAAVRVDARLKELLRKNNIDF